MTVFTFNKEDGSLLLNVEYQWKSSKKFKLRLFFKKQILKIFFFLNRKHFVIFLKNWFSVFLFDK